MYMWCKHNISGVLYNSLSYFKDFLPSILFTKNSTNTKFLKILFGSHVHGIMSLPLYNQSMYRRVISLIFIRIWNLGKIFMGDVTHRKIQGNSTTNIWVSIFSSVKYDLSRDAHDSYSHIDIIMKWKYKKRIDFDYPIIVIEFSRLKANSNILCPSPDFHLSIAMWHVHTMNFWL